MCTYGRRNIALLTVAPTGSVSMCTQTTSGIEPVFMIAYTRRDCIIVGGGNTFHLVAELHNYALMDVIADKVKKGVPYIGPS